MSVHRYTARQRTYVRRIVNMTSESLYTDRLMYVVSVLLRTPQSRYGTGTRYDTWRTSRAYVAVEAKRMQAGAGKEFTHR